MHAWNRSINFLSPCLNWSRNCIVLPTEHGRCSSAVGSRKATGQFKEVTMKRADVNVLLALMSLFALALLLNSPRHDSSKIPTWGKVRLRPDPPLRGDPPLNPIATSTPIPMSVVQQPVYVPPRSALRESSKIVSHQFFERRSRPQARVHTPAQAPAKAAVFWQEMSAANSERFSTAWEAEW